MGPLYHGRGAVRARFLRGERPHTSIFSKIFKIIIREIPMYEFVLLVWLLVPGQPPAAAIEVGTYYKLARCEAARDSVQVAREDVGFISICVERSK